MNDKELKDLAGIVARLSEVEKQLWDFWNTKHQERLKEIQSSKESANK